MKKNILIIVAIVIAVILTTTGIILNYTSTSKETQKEKPTQNDYSVKTINTVKVCLYPGCEPELIDVYAEMTHTYDSKVLQDAIKKINKTTTDYYKEVIATNMNDASCATLKENNKHSLRVMSRYDSYTTDKVITLAVQRTKINICTYEVTPIKAEAYVYDIKNDKLLTVSETKKLLGLTDKRILNAIRGTNKQISEIEQVQITTPEEFTDDEIQLYYGVDGVLYVEYFIKELMTTIKHL